MHRQFGKQSFFKQKFAYCSTNSKKFWDTVKSMENKNTSSQLPTAPRLGNTVTTDKSTIIENFNKHFSTAGHAFYLATSTLVNSPAPLTATFPSTSLSFRLRSPKIGKLHWSSPSSKGEAL